MTGRLADKVVIVTGGGSGFGEGIAKKFTEEGAKVVVADLSVDNGSRVAKELGCRFQYANVTKKEDWEALLKSVLDWYGQLDIVINNAGVTYKNKPTMQVTDEDFDFVMNVNVKSVYLSTSVLVPYFLENKRPGVFIQVSSTAGLRPRPGLVWYNASKGAVNIATKALAVEYAPSKIRFNTVCPVLGLTGLTSLFLGGEEPEKKQAFVNTVPLGRPSEPRDVANACCYLASDEADFITGVDFPVDGGRCV